MIAAATYAAWSWLSGSKLGKAVAAVAAFAAVVWFAWLRGESSGEDKVLDDQQDDYIDRTAAGRAAGRDAERVGAGMTGQDRLDAMRRNDGEWP